MADETSNSNHERIPFPDTSTGAQSGTGVASFSPKADPVPAERTPAAERLRAFEDEKFGADVVRINDRIERGSGSPFQDDRIMSPEDRRVYAALERLIVAEQKLADAHEAVIAAEAEHEAALADAEPKPETPVE